MVLKKPQQTRRVLSKETLEDIARLEASPRKYRRGLSQDPECRSHLYKQTQNYFAWIHTHLHLCNKSRRHTILRW